MGMPTDFHLVPGTYGERAHRLHLTCLRSTVGTHGGQRQLFLPAATIGIAGLWGLLSRVEDLEFSLLLLSLWVCAALAEVPGARRE